MTVAFLRGVQIFLLTYLPCTGYEALHFQLTCFSDDHHTFRAAQDVGHLSACTWLNDLSYGIKIWTDISSVLSQFTHLTDERMDSFLITRLRLHCMQHGKNSEMKTIEGQNA